MRPTLPVALLLLAAMLAGCIGAEEPPPQGTDPTPGPGPSPSPTAPTPGPGTGDPRPAGPTLSAPFWALGDAWTYTFRTPGAERTHELVVFRDDGEHWWLGLEDRGLALEHALRDTNPLIGRIHYDILSPHERGIHAGMYSFPLSDGKAWTGDLFRGTWQFRASWDAAQQRYLVEGREPGGRTIALDYDPAVAWFRSLAIRGPDGAEQLALTLESNRRGLTGTFHFLRGVDLFEGPGPGGPLALAAHTDEVAVEEGFDALGLSLAAVASGPASVVVLDPANQVHYNRTFQAGDAVDDLVELPALAGTWRVVTLGLANLEVEVRVAGLQAHVERV